MSSAGAARAGTGLRIRFPGEAGKEIMNMISASAAAPRTRGMTLKGWPALEDVYCNVERRRSWTGFKLMHQRAGAVGQETFPKASTLASSGPDVGRPGLLAGTARKAWVSTGRLKGESQREQPPPVGPALDSSLTLTYLAPVSSERPCPRDRGTPTRAHHPYPWGARARHPDDCTTDQEGGVRGGRLPPDQRSHPVGPGRLDLEPAPARRDRPSGTRGDHLGRKTRDARPGWMACNVIRAAGHCGRAARGPVERGGARWVRRAAQVHTSRGPISGPSRYPHHGRDGSAPEEAFGPRFAL